MVAPEDLRQQTIAAYQLESRATESEFDSITHLATELFGVPIAAVTILTRDRQVFQSVCGLDQDGTAREHAFCNYTVESDGALVVEDARADARFKDNPLVTGAPHIRFYAGWPIQLRSGVPVGSLCLIGREPRTFSDADASRLGLLAQVVA